MSLISRIKSDQVTARKARDPKSTLLTTLLGEAAIIGKNAGGRETTDEEVVAVVKKFLKGIDVILLHNPQDDQAKIEEAILKDYLPQQLDKGELAELITLHCIQMGYSEMRQMGKVMKFMNETYAGQFDGKEASALVKAFLSA